MISSYAADVKARVVDSYYYSVFFHSAFLIVTESFVLIERERKLETMQYLDDHVHVHIFPLPFFSVIFLLNPLHFTHGELNLIRLDKLHVRDASFKIIDVLFLSFIVNNQNKLNKSASIDHCFFRNVCLKQRCQKLH